MTTNEKICGTYWIVCAGDDKYLVQGERPKKTERGWFRQPGSTNWICVTRTTSTFNFSENRNSGAAVKSSDYSKVDFSDIECSEKAVEIERGKSGKVYTYEP